MFFSVISFLLGDIYLQTFPKLPNENTIFILLLIHFTLWLQLKKQIPFLHLPLAFLAGFTFTLHVATTTLSWTLPKDQEGKPQQITGHIASLPVSDQWQTSFQLALNNPQKTLIRLTTRNNKTQYNPGDEWQLQVRLKRLHGTLNPGSFDIEAWALQSGIRATGYILDSPENKRLSHHWYHYTINQIRANLLQKIQSHAPKSPTAPWLTALIIGERTGIAQENWRVLRNTGTNHLMAIAGLHIGIMSGLIHSIVTRLWRRYPRLMLRLPASLAGACAALLTAILYSALAGFSLPTQRACIMLSIFMITMLFRKTINAWHSWSFALFIVLLINPLSVLSESFWLSFGTIALIIYGMDGRLAENSFWWKYGRAQWVIGFGLIPLSLLFFQQTSIISFLANSIAIPWLGFLILPCCFLAGIFLFLYPPLGGVFLWMADKSLSGLWVILSWFSSLHFASWHQAMPTWSLFLSTLIAVLIFLLPTGSPGRSLSLIWILPLILYQPEKPKPGEFWISLLDVGQGLSVVVQTNAHTLVFDTGPKFNANFDMGESVVLPYLYTIGRNKIDMLVISHPDNDHIGGSQALLKALPIQKIKASAPEKTATGVTTYCLNGDSWNWDQVAFSFIYPFKDTLHLNNDSSCVLRVENGSKSVLLAGDVEKFSENIILERQSEKLRVNVLIAPHHGSKTSGIKEFIQAVYPQYVLYATGYKNRYHFPHASITNSYNEIGAHQLNTVDTGMIQFKLNKEEAPLEPIEYRMVAQKYWLQ